MSSPSGKDLPEKRPLLRHGRYAKGAYFLEICDSISVVGAMVFVTVVVVLLL